MSNMRSLFHDVPIFAGLSETSLALLDAATQRTHYDDGELVLLEDEANGHVFFVVAGELRVFRTNLDGREQLLTRLEAGDVFNLPTAFLSPRRSPATVAAVGPATLLTVPPDDFVRIATETPDIALAVMRVLSAKLHHFTDLTHDLSLRSVRARLANFLIVEMGAGDPGRWTQEKIAAQIGTVREVVSRTLRAFAKEGLIAIHRHQITILDQDALEVLAEL